MAKSLVAYFSASGVTKELAKTLAKAASADLYEIKPVVPYTHDDLNWLDKNSRSTIEMKDKAFRPEMVEENAHIENYDTIYLGFPVWWYIAPTIINTFLEKYDFANKKIILFATSGGSGFGKTVENLKPSVSETTEIIEGKVWVQGRLSENPTAEELREWIKTL